ncbi:TetR family transcriptional regulator [Agrococcus jejuensis]|uniref:Regulatory protein, tetR family n=1 Tax=Agrococcus jejuensis TaxID=399736 RepID=A0A1G8EPI2_9MICO|nr:TetR family transcriptional regulator [Agrococcus jejuensis]SDH71772.1 regulatory protein, tetR family [Agrococcus jejuensis]
MPRWEAGARDRLQLAALDLFASAGYERATVAEIAAAAGLTERTFFRHFADKREVLFGDPGVFDAAFLDAVAAEPRADAASLVQAALAGGAGFFPDERRAWSARRQAVIDATLALQERELLKLSGLAASLATAFADRGVPQRTAVLAAEGCVAMFRTAFAEWIADGETRAFATIADEVVAGWRALLATG